MGSHPDKGRKGLDRVVHATRHSFNGLRAAFHYESAFRQELWIAAVVFPLAMWLGQNWLERSVLAASITMVFVVELLNSGIEAAIDRVGAEHHELSKRAKDLASAAVFLALLLCATLLITAAVRRFIA